MILSFLYHSMPTHLVSCDPADVGNSVVSWVVSWVVSCAGSWGGSWGRRTFGLSLAG